MVHDDNSGGGWGCAGTEWEVSILPTQVCFDPKTGLKNQVYIKKRITPSSEHGLEITSDDARGW